MQTLQSDWLLFRSFGRNFRCKWIIKFLRRLKEGHKQIHDFKNFKIIEKPVRARKHRKFTKDN